jgi:hypothetical protein
MGKQNWKPGTMVYPLPAVMVSCGASKEDYNIITQFVPTVIHMILLKNMVNLSSILQLKI